MDTKKKPRTDKRRNVGKVAEVLIKNPNATIRDIAQETDLSVGAVYNSKTEVEKSGTKDPTINYIVGASKDYLKALSKINKAKILKEVKENLVEDSEGNFTFKEGKDIHIKDIVEYNKVGKEEMTRLTVLGGNVTDDNGGLIKQDFSLLTDAQLDELLNK